MWVTCRRVTTSVRTCEVEPATQYDPGVHVPLHTADGSAADSPYCPGGHSEHEPDPLTEYCPAKHTALVALVDAAVQ